MPPSLPVDQRRALFEALVDAFPDIPELKVMVTEGYGVNFARVTSANAKLEIAVSEVITYAVGRETIPELVAAARADNPTNSRLRAIAEKIGLAFRAFESSDYEAQIVKQAGFQSPEPWRDLMSRNELCVFRIEVSGEEPGQPSQGIGTGFLVGPSMALTCDHVFEENGIYAGRVPRDRIKARFDYKRAADGHTARDGSVYAMRGVKNWVVDRSPKETLDYALFQLDGSPGEDQIGSPQSPKRNWLTPEAYRFEVNEPLLVLQHPSGDPLAFAIGPVSEVEADRVWHKANTQSGSSGSPCFSIGWKLAALHHWGSEEAGKNRAVSLEQILAAMKKNGSDALLGKRAD